MGLTFRHIPEKEVAAMLSKGTVNGRKSERGVLPCPKYVVDAQVGKRGKNVQVIFCL